MYIHFTILKAFLFIIKLLTYLIYLSTIYIYIFNSNKSNKFKFIKYTFKLDMKQFY